MRDQHKAVFKMKCLYGTIFRDKSFLNDEGSEDSSDEETNFNPREICILQRTATLKNNDGTIQEIRLVFFPL